ncbi:unnamed protein product [Spirodela intermedia]|uniref:glutathione transferase n=1 Tax=Spirodela intermedia TaxID=51605 RepID=A0A7I8K303_SPIIN|nr:unnamed protein product [Spirodela intermedia]
MYATWERRFSGEFEADPSFLCSIEKLMASVTVLGSPACTDVARVLACLFEKEVDFQLVRQDNFKRERKLPEFLKLQDPSGQVTYKEADRTLFDSRAICRHVSRKFARARKNQNNLLGTGALEKALVEQWLQVEEQQFEKPSSFLLFNLAHAPLIDEHDVDPEEIARQIEKLSDVLDLYEKRLASSEYLAGDKFTLADLTHLPNSHYLVNNTEKGRTLFKSKANVYRWWEAISSRESWRMVLQLQEERPALLEK